MANIPSLGGAPISFVDANGMQYAIPLPWIGFAGTPAAPVVSSWPGWSGAASTQQAGIGTWLGGLATQFLLTPGAAPPNPPAFVITAAHPGSAGNDITIAFTAVHADNTMDVTVSTTQIYPGLTPTSIETILGTPTTAGTQPGLAVVGTALGAMPAAAATPALFSASADPPSYPVPDADGELLPAFTGPDAGLITASITAVNISTVATVPSTFTLTLAWSKSAANVAASGLGAAFSYLITVAPPSGGAYGPVPAAGSSVTLLGGTDPAASAAATAAATVISA